MTILRALTGCGGTLTQKALQDSLNVCLSATCATLQMGGEALLLSDDNEFVNRLRKLSEEEKRQSMLVYVSSDESDDGKSWVEISYPFGNKNGSYLANEVKRYLSRIKELRLLPMADYSLRGISVYGVPLMLVEYKIPREEFRTSARGKATGQLGWMLARLIQRTVNGSGGG